MELELRRLKLKSGGVVLETVAAGFAAEVTALGDCCDPLDTDEAGGIAEAPAEGGLIGFVDACVGVCRADGVVDLSAGMGVGDAAAAGFV